MLGQPLSYRELQEQGLSAVPYQTRTSSKSEHKNTYFIKCGLSGKGLSDKRVDLLMQTSVFRNPNHTWGGRNRRHTETSARKREHIHLWRTCRVRLYAVGEQRLVDQIMPAFHGETMLTRNVLLFSGWSHVQTLNELRRLSSVRATITGKPFQLLTTKSSTYIN